MAFLPGGERKGSLLRPVLALAAALALPSCDSAKDPVAAADVWTVVYAVELVGSGTVTGIVYENGSGGTVPVASPGAGWSTTLFLPPGSTIGLRAQAALGEGRFRVYVDARSPRLPPVIRLKDCTGTATACDLEISKETLP
ncbi:MAG: hypothetical protein U0529_16590 [Thermoanaerobaculia bacterium]